MELSSPRECNATWIRYLLTEQGSGSVGQRKPTVSSESSGPLHEVKLVLLYVPKSWQDLEGNSKDPEAAAESAWGAEMDASEMLFRTASKIMSKNSFKKM